MTSSAAVDALAAAHPGRTLVLFDGECGLCDRTVAFLTARDGRDRLRFSPLGGPTADLVLRAGGVDPSRRDTMFAVTLGGPGGSFRVRERGRAALFAVTRLGLPWSLLAVAGVLPTPWLDAAYRFVARRRHRLAPPACRVPTPAERAKVI